MNSDKKLTTELIILRIVFLVAPFILFTLLLPTSIESSLGFFSSGVSTNFTSVTHYEQKTISFNVKQAIKSDIKYKMYYILGKELDLSLIKLCITNMGTLYTDLDVSSFESYIIVDGKEKIILLYNGTTCYELSPHKDNYVFNYSTRFNYNPTDERRFSNESVDLSNPVISDMRAEINYSNLFIVFFVFLIGYWAICWLFTRVIIITKKGLELSK